MTGGAQTHWTTPEARLRTVDARGRRQVVQAEVVRFNVEQRHHGVSWASITIVAAEPGGGHPPWLHRDMKALGPGAWVQVDVRYRGGLPARIAGGNVDVRLTTDGDDALSDWVPLIIARIATHRQRIPSGGAAQIDLQCEDLLGLIRRDPPRVGVFERIDESDIVRANLDTFAPTIATEIDPSGIAGPLPFVQQPRHTSALAFLTELADRLDFELYADVNPPSDPDGTPTIRFRRSRARQPSRGVDVVYAFNLIGFSATASPWTVATDVIAKGIDPEECTPFEVSADTSALQAEVDTSSPMISAVDIREQAASREGSPPDNVVYLSANNLDGARAQRWCDAVYLRRARGFLTAEAVVVGLPSLRAGAHVQLRGLYAPYDGRYYVTRATHAFDQAGYRTTLQLERAGWSDPATYPRRAEAS